MRWPRWHLDVMPRTGSLVETLATRPRLEPLSRLLIETVDSGAGDSSVTSCLPPSGTLRRYVAHSAGTLPGWCVLADRCLMTGLTDG